MTLDARTVIKLAPRSFAILFAVSIVVAIGNPALRLSFDAL